MGRLYRSRHNRVIGGVAGGLGEYFQIDPVIIRLIWVLLGFAGGNGLLLYIIAWILIPERPTVVTESTEEPARGEYAEGEEYSSAPKSEWSTITIDQDGQTGREASTFVRGILVIAGLMLLMEKAGMWVLGGMALARRSDCSGSSHIGQRG